MSDNRTENEDLFAEEILALINDDSNGSVDDISVESEDNLVESSGNHNTSGLKLIDSNEDIFGIKDSAKDNTNGAEPTLSVGELFGDISDEELDSNHLSKEGKLIADNLKISESQSVSLFESKSKKSETFWNRKSGNCGQNSGDDSLKEVFSGIRLINPMVSSHKMKELMSGRKMIKMSLIKSNINKQTNDVDDDWVTIGVIIGKIAPKVSKNGKQYSIWKLSDLKTKNVVTFFLFGDVYAEHWKLPVGCVIGLLNPRLMDNESDSKYSNKNEICSLTLDNSAKLLVLGTAKDLGYCKAVKKNQEVCGALINLGEEDYCVYHIKTAYKRFSSKRAELQSTFSNIEPKNSAFNPNNEFFANAFSDGQRKDVPIIESKKFSSVEFKEKREKEMTNLSKVVKNPISKAAKNLALSVNELKSDPKTKNSSVISAKDVFNSIKREKNEFGFTQFVVPTLAKGYKRGEMIDLNAKSDPKRRAIEALKAKPIVTEDPNGLKKNKNKRALDRIKAKIDSELKSSDNSCESEEETKTKKMKSDLINRALSRKSVNGHEVEVAETKAQQKYFSTLEKKEKMENKLLETMEIECQVISCHNCKYTAHSASELCKRQQHKLVRHKATKRFFKCKNCKNRSFAFNLFLPTKACSKCGQTSYAKTSVINVRDETSLLEKKLQIRGEEQKFLNSLR